MDRKLHLLESFTAQGTDGRTYRVFGYEHLVRDSRARVVLVSDVLNKC
jgi:hypothetical protein